MKSIYVALTFALFAAACGSGTEAPPPTTPPLPTATMPAAPTGTEEPAPTQLPTDVPATEAAADPAAFRDDFEGSLGAGWQWRNEDADNWSLTETPGSLQINIIGGQVSDDSILNLLLRDAPSGDFQIETKVTVRPQANYQFAGLVIYESAANFMQAGRAFCDAADLCVGEGLYLDHYNGGNFITPNIVAPFAEDEVYLRLVRQGDTYTFETSSDGSDWTERGQVQSEIDPQQVGLAAGQNTAGALPAVFDYFEVSGLP